MSKHTMKATVPHGDPDIGAEVDLEITFEYRRGRPAVMYLRNGDPGYPADPDEIEFISCKGPLGGELRQEDFDALAQQYLGDDVGEQQARETVADNDERAREYAAELRADR